MASSSHNDSLDETFDQYFDQYFDQTFENLVNAHGDQENERKTRKKEFLSNEIAKKAISGGYGIIISVTFQHIQIIYSDDDLE
ncbi:unnamed protein product [Brassica oleracea var. botrytis]